MAAANRTGREIRLVSRPADWPSPENFALAEVEAGPPAEGEVVVRNVFVSVEPYMRGRMNDTPSYVPPYRIGEALEGGAVGVVVDSREPALPNGTWVSSMLGWRELARGPAAAFRMIDVALAPPAAYLGVLGVPGFTAWIGLREIANLRAGETLFVSSAAGAVGSIAGQLAKHLGARAVGSAGGPEKVRYLTERLGFDAAFDYRAGKIRAQLAAAAPDGIDVYFDNVGGEQLEAALAALRPFGRIALCGMIAGYNEPLPGPRNLAFAIGKRLTLRGFIVLDHYARYEEFLREVAPLVRAGTLVAPESIVEGIERAPQAFIEMLRGGTHLGKVLVRVGSDDPV
ncbi:MAG: NADP-dependent oxidoreductase [Vulcanimicrobiaceae bacterium]